MAAKPKRLPPFTTLATRLTPTSLSTSSESSRSAPRSPPRPPRRPSSRPRPEPGARAMSRTPLERQAALSGGIGQRLDAAVEEIAAAIEDDFLDAGSQRTLGDQLADRGSARLVGAILHGSLELLVVRRSGRNGVAAAVVDHLGIHVLARAEDAQPRPAAGALRNGVAHAPAAALEEFVGRRH